MMSAAKHYKNKEYIKGRTEKREVYVNKTEPHPIYPTVGHLNVGSVGKLIPMMSRATPSHQNVHSPKGVYHTIWISDYHYHHHVTLYIDQVLHIPALDKVWWLLNCRRMNVRICIAHPKPDKHLHTPIAQDLICSQGNRMESYNCYKLTRKYCLRTSTIAPHIRKFTIYNKKKRASQMEYYIPLSMLYQHPDEDKEVILPSLISVALELEIFPASHIANHHQYHACIGCALHLVAADAHRDQRIQSGMHCGNFPQRLA